MEVGRKVYLEFKYSVQHGTDAVNFQMQINMTRLSLPQPFKMAKRQNIKKAYSRIFSTV